MAADLETIGKTLEKFLEQLNAEPNYIPDKLTRNTMKSAAVNARAICLRIDTLLKLFEEEDNLNCEIEERGYDIKDFSHQGRKLLRELLSEIEVLENRKKTKQGD